MRMCFLLVALSWISLARFADAGEEPKGQPAQQAGSAVEPALQWLARHQEKDGHWDPTKWESPAKTDPAVTGLALLAFLGAGYTENEGPFKDNVRKATQWIISRQEASGRIGTGFEGAEGNGVGYHHAICGLALAEAYAKGKNAQVGAAAQRAVAYSTNVHQVPGSGWRYTAKAASDDPAGTADLSVTGWFVMQLKSAKIAGLDVPASGFQGAIGFLDKVSDKYGRCRYQPSWLSPSAPMTSVGMLCRLLTGSPPDDPKVAGGVEYIMKSLPEWGEDGSKVNMYYWHYGTRSMSLVGGEKMVKWNEAVKGALCKNQCKGGAVDGSKQDKDGSWDPVCTWGAKGGRVYSTAMGAMILEICSRADKVPETGKKDPAAGGKEADF